MKESEYALTHKPQHHQNVQTDSNVYDDDVAGFTMFNIHTNKHTVRTVPYYISECSLLP